MPLTNQGKQLVRQSIQRPVDDLNDAYAEWNRLMALLEHDKENVQLSIETLRAAGKFGQAEQALNDRGLTLFENVVNIDGVWTLDGGVVQTARDSVLPNTFEGSIYTWGCHDSEPHHSFDEARKLLDDLNTNGGSVLRRTGDKEMKYNITKAWLQDASEKQGAIWANGEEVKSE